MQKKTRLKDMVGMVAQAKSDKPFTDSAKHSTKGQSFDFLVG